MLFKITSFWQGVIIGTSGKKNTNSLFDIIFFLILVEGTNALRASGYA